MTYSKLVVIIALASHLVCARAGDTAPVMANLVGGWKLFSFSFQKEDGSVVFPFGENPVGIAIYDAKGNMSAQIMRADIPKFRSRERTGDPTDQEMRIAYEGYVGYGGKYDIDATNSAVVFHLKVSSYPNWVGTDLTRSLELAGNDRLTLRAKIPSMEGVPATLVQIWHRMN